MAKAGRLTEAPTITIPAEEPVSLGPAPVSPPFDAAEILPPRASEKMRALRLRASEAHALVPQFAQQQDARVELQRAEQWLKRLLDPAGASDGGFHLHETDNRVVAGKKQVAKLTDDLKRLIERGEARAASCSASGALAACDAWLRDGRPRGVSLQDHEAKPVKLNGESLLDGIENRRRKVTELRADLARIEVAPLPSSFAKQQGRAQIDALASRGAVKVGLLVEHDGKIEFPTQQVRAMVHNATPGAVAYHDAVDVVGLLAFVLRPTLIAVIDHLIDEAADDRSALTPEARQLRIAEVESDLLDIERQEAWLTWAAMDERLPVEHRADISVPALLGLQLLIATPRAAPSLETSPMWAIDYVGR